MIRLLLAILGWAAALAWAALWSLELRRAQEREDVLFEQIGMLEDALRVPVAQRYASVARRG